MLKIFRKSLNLKNEEIESFAGLKNKSSIYYLEKSFKTNKLFRYLMLLRKKGVNINSFLDDEIKNNNL
ncbi:hypothetical protein [Flavobacterium psychrophilum]|uniref:hypothetical protein n=1 Tax=Flavobacterium psychrophilum TaxID=96345 RepID=UPI00106C12B4|nr:hypothetical protein [Flavobacterium psychrophilum]